MVLRKMIHKMLWILIILSYFGVQGGKNITNIADMALGSIAKQSEADEILANETKSIATEDVGANATDTNGQIIDIRDYGNVVSFFPKNGLFSFW